MAEKTFRSSTTKIIAEHHFHSEDLNISRTAHEFDFHNKHGRKGSPLQEQSRPPHTNWNAAISDFRDREKELFVGMVQITIKLCFLFE